MQFRANTRITIFARSCKNLPKIISAFHYTLLNTVAQKTHMHASYLFFSSCKYRQRKCVSTLRIKWM